MAILYADVCNLIERFRPESQGKEVLTLGRSNVYLHRNEIASLKKQFAGDPEALHYLQSYKWGDYHEQLFAQLFKCSKVDSLDFSNFEGATIVHDLQQPITEDLRCKYDLIFDGGTLEHIFNFPTAMANLIQLARVGGLVYSQTPSNNLSGHGFFQLSPEMAYRTMSEKNGMELIFVRIGIARFPSIEMSSFHKVYEVADPALVGSRVRLQSQRPVYMMFMARRIADVKPFTHPVLQSDYVQAWSGAGHRRDLDRMRKILRRLPFRMRCLVHGYWGLIQSSLSNRKHYRVVR